MTTMRKDLTPTSNRTLQYFARALLQTACQVTRSRVGDILHQKRLELCASVVHQGKGTCQRTITWHVLAPVNVWGFSTSTRNNDLVLM